MCEATPLNWVDLYLTLTSAGINDPAFSWFNIKRIPLKMLSNIYKGVTEYTHKKANIEAFTTAQLAYNFYYFSTSFGKDGKTSSADAPEFKNFLPFPNAWKSSETSKSILTEKSRRVIQHLINTDSIGVKLAMLVSPYMN